jgi:carboxymethylenebutenolidase
MRCSGKWTISAPAFSGLTILALALGGGRVLAADEKEAVKKSNGSYLSAKGKINVTRFDPAAPGPHPAVLLLHGIDGAEKNAAIYHRLAGNLAVKGYVVFVVRYFDCFADRPEELAFFCDNVKDHLTGAAVKQPDRVKRAFQDCLTVVSDGVQYVRTQPGVDKDRVGVAGFSLGAFLALSAATQPKSEIAAVVDLFGGLPQEMHGQAKILPPVLILHGDKDKVVPEKIARDLEKLLKNNEKAHEIEVYKGVGHMFDKGDGKIDLLAALDAESRAHAFLDKYLKDKNLKKAEK